MKDETSIFGAKSERLDRLVFEALDQPEPEEQVSPTASLGAVLEQLGDQIGRYKLLNVLGEGGMGIVYLAEQKHPIRRQVALKVIKPGMDSARVIARFEAERQALALLDHPNIAHVYDAGTTESGRPFFVMEYVKGLSITEHCDRHKLTIEDRLNLFRQVCLAVHHAHQKGIIHRDIKPSNILISTQDDQAVPKIIDFGVAKALAQPLTERTLVTEQGQLFGTPEYMSPEQADMANEDIDTRSDIYSLGMLLYVLLTGVLPFDSTTFREGGIEHIRQVIRESNPKTPSTRLSSLGEEAQKVAQSRQTEIATLAKKLHKELEWIPLKAMRKERSERYRSASEFADDVENYLKSAPLLAGPPSTVYQLKKFVRRNRVLVAAVFIVATTLLLGLAATTTMYLRAEHQAKISEAVNTFLRKDLLASVDPERGMGRDVTIRSFLDIASENLNGKFQNEPLVEASIRDTLGWTYRQLGEYEDAEPHLERALQIRKEHLGTEHLDTLESINRLAWLRCDQSRYAEAAELLEKSLATCRRIHGDEHVNTLGTVNGLAIMYKDLGRHAESERMLSQGIHVARQTLGEKNGLTLYMIGNLGQTYEVQGRYKEAELQYLEMLQLRDGVWEDDNPGTLIFKSFLARIYRKQNRYQEAERLYLDILPIQQHVLGEDHPWTLWSVSGLAWVYMEKGEHDEAEQLFTKAMKGMFRMQGEEHRDTLRCTNGLAVLYTRQQRYNEAEKLLMNTLNVSRRRLGENHPWTLTSVNSLAIVYKEQGNYDQAEPLLLKALKGRRLKLSDEHPHTLESWQNLIELYEAWGKPEKAEEWRVKLRIVD